MKSRMTLIGLLFITLFLAACGAQASEDSYGYDSDTVSTEREAADYAEEVAGAPAGVDGEIGAVIFESDAIVTEQQSQIQDRLIIRTGWLSITVSDPDATVSEISSMATGLGGWVVSSEMNEYSNGKQGSVTIRIPAGTYEDAVATLKTLAVEVKSESSSSQDVTEEFVDLNARLGNLEATRDRVLTFLDETENVEEALAVNQELSRLEGEIEVIKGRMQYLTNSATFSTITINVAPDIVTQPLTVGRWRPQGVAKDAIETLVNTLQGLAEVVIWLAIYVLPVALVIGLPIYFIGRGIRRWFKRRKPAVNTPMATDA